MNFSGSDLFYFITEILEDFQDLGNADLVGLGFRVVVLFFGAVFFILFLKFMWRIFWDLFGGILQWFGRTASIPYTVPRDALKRRKQWKQREKKRLERESIETEQRQLREREAEEKARREAEIFERIMK